MQDMQDMQNVINEKHLNMFKGVVGDKFDMLIDRYIQDSVDVLEKLKKAMQDQDFTNIYNNVHALKSPSEQIGALDLADLCLKMEALAYAKNEDGMDKLYEDIVSNYNKVELYIKNM